MSSPSDPLGSLLETVEREPENREARLRLAVLLGEQGERAAARRLLETLTADEGSLRREALARLALLDEEEGRPDEAEARWERRLADDIDDAEAWSQLERLRARREEPALDAASPPPGAAPATLGSPEGVNVSRYELLREIGRGGSATVYLARDRQLGLELALKVLHVHLAGAQATGARERFFHEARAAAALRHPGVVAIYDVDDQARTITMEYLPGGTLRDRLRACARGGGRGLPLEEAEALARSLLETLAYVHEHGVVHGDITPRNVLLRRPGAGVLVDFGIARLAEDRAEDERGGGTPLYLAPEQFRGAPLAPPADLFSLGALLWEAIAGQPLREHADLTGDRHAPRPLPTEARTRAGDSWLVPLVEALLRPLPTRVPSAAEALAAFVPPSG